MISKYEGSPTTRTFPRTSSDAFRDADASQWWFAPEDTRADRALFWSGVIMWVALITYFVVTA